MTKSSPQALPLFNFCISYLNLTKLPRFSVPWDVIPHQLITWPWLWNFYLEISVMICIAESASVAKGSTLRDYLNSIDFTLHINRMVFFPSENAASTLGQSSLICTVTNCWGSGKWIMCQNNHTFLKLLLCQVIVSSVKAVSSGHAVWY